MTAPRPPTTLLERLLNPASAEAAAAELAAAPGWLQGVPPPEVLDALGEPGNPYDGAVANLARVWRQPDILPALAGALQREHSIDRRRRLAWSIKQVCTEDLVPTLLPYLDDPGEDRIVRRYLMEAMTHCTISQDDSWPGLQVTARVLLQDPDPLIREGATALVGMADGHAAERRALLIGQLEDTDEAVVATAASLLQRFSVQETDLPAELVQRLVSNSSPRVRRAALDLLKRVLPFAQACHRPVRKKRSCIEGYPRHRP